MFDNFADLFWERLLLKKNGECGEKIPDLCDLVQFLEKLRGSRLFKAV